MRRLARGAGNKETNGEFWRSRTACSLESSSNLITCRGDDDILLPFIVADYSSGPCHGQFRSQSLSKVADQPWFLPENQGDPLMQIHPTRIDIFVIHKFSSGATIIFPPANRKLQFRHIRRNRQPESG